MRSDKENDSPLVRCFEVKAAPPSLDDNTADIDRLKLALMETLGQQEGGDLHLHIPFQRIGLLASAFRSAGFRGYAVVNMLPAFGEIVDFLPQKPQVLPAMALDLGTTHLEASILDLLTGKKIAESNIENRQIEFGSDILSRIHMTNPRKSNPDEVNGGLQKLQEKVTESINDLAGLLADMAGISTREIRALSVSGNTTMVHLFMGLSPYHICREPYTPLVNDPDPCHANELGIIIDDMAPVWVLPSIGSYFGGDLISGILACGLDTLKDTCMLIDVGTNAEVVLGNRDWLIACAGAAGPALEGGVARMGMRAGPGAIEHVSINMEDWTLSYATIEGRAAAGICGSGLIDLVAELYLARVIDFRGKFRKNIEPDSMEHENFLQQRLCSDNDETFFIVVLPVDTANGHPVILSQIDLDALMRSKAAMYAILTTLVSQVGVSFDEIEKIFVAGAFGKHIDPHQAITLGMLPDLPLSTYEPVGNSSLKGAEHVLASEEYRRRSKEIRQKITYVELNVNQEFMIRFSGSRFIPHTDVSLFPTVPVFQDSHNLRSS